MRVYQRTVPNNEVPPSQAAQNLQGQTSQDDDSPVGCGKTILARQNFDGRHFWTKGEYPVGCSKRPDFSPAQPCLAETRLVPSKAAASEAASRTLRYVDPLSDARTPLADFFSILLESLARKVGVLYSRVWFRRSLTVPVPTDPGPLHSIPPALFRAHESFQTGGYQGHKIRLVSGQESGNPP